VIGIAAACWQQSGTAQDKPSDADHLQVFWQDGSTTLAADIDGWSKTETPGEGVLHSASIDGNPLFKLRPLARLIRNTKLSAELTGPFIQLSNGDTLPGSPVTSTQPSDSTDQNSVLIRVTDPLFAIDARRNLIRVRRNSIARIALSDREPDGFAPGLVAFRDGGTMNARSVRWNTNGIRMLTDRSVQVAAWADLADIHLPNVDRMQAVLQDTLVELPQDSDFLGRMVTTGGAVLSFHGRRFRMGVHHGQLCHIVQPAWALNAIYVPVDSIVSTSYRAIDEVPLSLLPAVVLTQRSVFGHSFKWKRNRNVKGQPLASGKLRADLGIGMWSHREIAFEMPPRSVAFSAWAGIDRGVPEGGCVRCRIYRDEVSGSAIWTSGLLRSGQEPVRVEVANLNNARRLVLVAEFAHEERQKGDLPFDICDMVSWLSPIVRISREQLPQSPDIEHHFPELAGWSITEETRKRITVRSFYDSRRGSWRPAMVLDAERAPDATVAPLVLTRELDVTLASAWLVAATGRDDQGKSGYRVKVSANGKHIPGTEGYDSNTTGYAPGDSDTVAYSLGAYAGQKVTVTVAVHPSGKEHAQLCGLLWAQLSLSPLIQDLPDSGEPIEPDLFLTSLPSLAAEVAGGDALKSLSAQPTPLLRSFPMKNSISMTADTKAIRCELDPRSRRFVACIGPSGFSGEVGPFQVWIDDKMLWQSGPITRLTRVQQIDIQLPTEPGKRLTLRVVNKTKKPVTWGNAGFMFQ